MTKTSPVHRVFTFTNVKDGLPTIAVHPFSSGEGVNGLDISDASWVPEGETKFLSKGDFRFYTLRWFSNGLRETIDDAGNVVSSDVNPNWEAFLVKEDVKEGLKEFIFTDGTLLQAGYIWNSGASVLETLQPS